MQNNSSYKNIQIHVQYKIVILALRLELVRAYQTADD